MLIIAMIAAQFNLVFPVRPSACAAGESCRKR